MLRRIEWLAVDGTLSPCGSPLQLFLVIESRPKRRWHLAVDELNIRQGKVCL